MRVITTTVLLTLAVAGAAQASYRITGGTALTHARHAAVGRASWEVEIDGELYMHTFGRTRGTCRARSRLVEGRAHRWLCFVYDPIASCRQVFGPGVFGNPGVTLLILGSRVPSRWYTRTLEGLRCHGD